MSFKDKLFLLGIWNIGVVESGIEDVFNNPAKMKIRWIKHHYRDRIFADPFLYNQDSNYYYFLVEEHIFYETKGKISLLTVDKKTMKLVNKKIILNEDYHLSYPYIFDDYIIPEGSQSNATYAYKKEDGAGKYIKIKINENALLDPTLLKHDDKYWIFATTRKKKEDAVTKLSIFYSDNLGAFIPHKMNPVKVDIKTTRPGGKFFEYQGKLYRPAQDCEKLYGHLIRIMEVRHLSDQEYEEQEVMALSSRLSPPYNMGFHTFNVYENCILVDGYREYYSYLLKPFLKILLFLNRRRIARGKKIENP